MHNEHISYGAWLRERRLALRLTQSRLAARIGCATVTVAKIERDERRPSIQVAQLLARHLGLSPELYPLFIAAARGDIAVGHLPPPWAGAEASILIDLERAALSAASAPLR